MTVPFCTMIFQKPGKKKWLSIGSVGSSLGVAACGTIVCWSSFGGPGGEVLRAVPPGDTDGGGGDVGGAGSCGVVLVLTLLRTRSCIGVGRLIAWGSCGASPGMVI